MSVFSALATLNSLATLLNLLTTHLLTSAVNALALLNMPTMLATWLTSQLLMPALNALAPLLQSYPPSVARGWPSLPSRSRRGRGQTAPREPLSHPWGLGET